MIYYDMNINDRLIELIVSKKAKAKAKVYVNISGNGNEHI